MEGSTNTGSTNTEVIAMVKAQAKRHGSSALIQPASRITATTGMSVDDLSARSRGLTTVIIAKLVNEAKDDATEEAYCEVQMSKTEAMKE